MQWVAYPELQFLAELKRAMYNIYAMQCELKIICNVHEHVAKSSWLSKLSRENVQWAQV